MSWNTLLQLRFSSESVAQMKQVGGTISRHTHNASFREVELAPMLKGKSHINDDVQLRIARVRLQGRMQIRWL